MIQHELDFEEQIIRINDEMKYVFTQARKMKKRIIITSDTYLPVHFINRILEKNGLQGVARMYISCKLRRTKASGHLFDILLKYERKNPSTILHIGDSKLSDQTQAGKHGLSTVWYPRKLDQLFLQDKRMQQLYEAFPNRTSISIFLGLLSNNCQEQSYWQRFGYVYGGPTVLGYMEWLDEVLPDDVDVLFVARDGYILKRVFDRLNTRKAVRTHYIYAPRTVLFAINFKYKTKYSYQEILEYFKTKSRLLQEITPANLSLEQAKAFIEEHYSTYKSLVEYERKEFKDYLHTFQIQAQAVAVVDSSSGQLTAQTAITYLLNDSTVQGYYFLVTRKKNPEEHFFTFQNEVGRPMWRCALLELIMTAPEPPISDLIKGKPKYTIPMKEERVLLTIYPEIEKGIIQFVEDYQTLFGTLHTGLTADEINQWLQFFHDNPTERDKKEFHIVQHAYGVPHSYYMPIMSDWYK